MTAIVGSRGREQKIHPHAASQELALVTPSAASLPYVDLLQRHHVGLHLGDDVSHPVDRQPTVVSDAAVDVVGHQAKRTGRHGGHSDFGEPLVRRMHRQVPIAVEGWLAPPTSSWILRRIRLWSSSVRWHSKACLVSAPRKKLRSRCAATEDSASR